MLGLCKSLKHTDQAMAYARDMMEASSSISMSGGFIFKLSIGMHTGAAQVSETSRKEAPRCVCCYNDKHWGCTSKWNLKEGST
jgi:hypothetical protein